MIFHFVFISCCRHAIEKMRQREKKKMLTLCRFVSISEKKKQSVAKFENFFNTKSILILKRNLHHFQFCQNKKKNTKVTGSFFNAKIRFLFSKVMKNLIRIINNYYNYCIIYYFYYNNSNLHDEFFFNVKMFEQYYSIKFVFIKKTSVVYNIFGDLVFIHIMFWSKKDF